MASTKSLGIGKRGRGLLRKVKRNASLAKMNDLVAAGRKKGSTGSTPTGPAWKPVKTGVTGNYGKAVSTAAKARNAARKTGPSMKVTPARTPDAPSTGPGPGKVGVPRGETPRRLNPNPLTTSGRQTGPGVNNPPAIRAAKKFRAAGGNIGAETVLARRAASKPRRTRSHS